MRPINTDAFAASADRTNIAERVATYLAAPAATNPQLRAAEIARVTEQREIERVTRGPRVISTFWTRPVAVAPAAPPAA